MLKESTEKIPVQEKMGTSNQEKPLRDQQGSKKFNFEPGTTKRTGEW